MVLICNVSFAQFNDCYLKGRISIDGIGNPDAPASVGFYDPNTMANLGGEPLAQGYFNVTLAPNVEFKMVVFVPGTGYFAYPSNGNGTTYNTNTCSGGASLPGFDSFNNTFSISGPPCGTLACALPVEFLSFTAKAQDDNTVRLEWATVWEEDNEYFTVERSMDGANFEALGTRAGAGTTIERQNYDWTDESPLPGINYYRIKQTDFDGAFSYSDVASVRMNGVLGQEMRIFPNPAEAQVRISLPSVGKSGTATVRVFNHVGQAVLSQEQSTEGQLLEIDTSSLPSGVYTLQVQAGARNYSEKLVVR